MDRKGIVRRASNPGPQVRILPDAPNISRVYVPVTWTHFLILHINARNSGNPETGSLASSFVSKLTFAPVMRCN